MSITLEIEKMTRDEKLQAMEALWNDISGNGSDVVSPAWHEAALKETEARYLAGQEGVSNWDDAKKELRKRFQ
ncbi:MAG: addiction module protein [Kiritimatiellae bacterium]|jgi:hypothetical protein|nr:addiction module protein [Kiritimatiellia bacterium]